MARLPDPTDTLAGADRDIYERMLAARKSRGTGVYGPYTALLNHPELAERIERLGYFLKFESVLPRDIYQFVVLSFSRRMGMEFTWADHIGPARESGLPETIIAAIKSGEGDIAEPYASVKRCMEEVLSFRSIPDGLQSRIVELYGVKGLIEVVALCGLYSLIGMVNVSFDVPISARPDNQG